MSLPRMCVHVCVMMNIIIANQHFGDEISYKNLVFV